MAKLKYKDFEEIENEDKTVLAKMLIDAIGQVYALKAEVVELHKIVCEKETENDDDVKTEEYAREFLKVGDKNFKKLLNSEKGMKLKYITNAKGSKFFNLDDLIEYKNWLFSEEFSMNEYFMNPDYFAEKGEQSAHKNFEKYPNKENKN